jgi:2'-hydroxyisoflavone reductase
VRLLVLGGTLFLGRAVVDLALECGHEVTLFNRGRTNPGLYPHVEHVTGDRDHDLTGLAGRSFDAVVDTSGYFPRQIRSVVSALGPVGHYTFVSSVSAYADHSAPGADESAELATVTDPSAEDLDVDYGGFKAQCESTLDQLVRLGPAAQRSGPRRVHHVRAGLIVGPYDDTGRFTYWVRRIAAGGTVLAPEPRDQPVQLIDVRDLARWILHAVATNVTGALNAVGTPGGHTMGSLLSTIARVAGSDAQLEWVAEPFLLERKVKPWSDLPLWLPPASMPTHAGFMSRGNRAALDAGLQLRPVEDTVTAILAQLAREEARMTKDFGTQLPEAGLSPTREAELLAQWRHESGEIVTPSTTEAQA